MTILEIFLLLTLYFLTVAFWTSFLILGGDNLKAKLATYAAVLMFVPGINTLGAFMLFLLLWVQKMVNTDGEANP